MGSGGWNRRRTTQHDYEIGRVYYQLVMNPDPGSGPDDIWRIIGYKVVKETKQYVDIEGSRGGVGRKLKPWVAYATPEASIEARIARYEFDAREARESAARKEAEAELLRRFLASPVIISCFPIP